MEISKNDQNSSRNSRNKDIEDKENLGRTSRNKDTDDTENLIRNKDIDDKEDLVRTSRNKGKGAYQTKANTRIGMCIVYERANL